MHHDLLRNLFIPALTGMLTVIPILLVYLAGLVIALVSWRRYPRPSLLVAISCITMFILLIVQQFAFRFFWLWEESSRIPMHNVSWILGVMNITFNLLHAGALCLLLIAVYAGQRSASVSVEQAIPGVQRVSTPLYVISTALAQFLGGPLFIAGVILLVVSSNSYSDDSPVALFIVMTLVGSLLALLGSILYLVLIYKAWESIQDGYARTTPGKAVGYLFIPFYNFYWVFQAIPGFADDYNAYLDRAKISAPPLDRGILQALAVLQLLSAIPYLGAICLLPLMPIYCIVAAKLCTAINALPESAALPEANLSK